MFCVTSLFAYQIFLSFIYCRYPDVLENLSSPNSDSAHIMFILYHRSRSKGLSCFMQFAKECNYFRVICLFFWQLITSKIRSHSQDWITLFLSSFYLRFPFDAMFYVPAFFYPNKVLLIVNILQILKFLKQALRVFLEQCF